MTSMWLRLGWMMMGPWWLTVMGFLRVVDGCLGGALPGGCFRQGFEGIKAGEGRLQEL